MEPGRSYLCHPPEVYPKTLRSITPSWTPAQQGWVGFPFTWHPDGVPSTAWNLLSLMQIHFFSRSLRGSGPSHNLEEPCVWAPPELCLPSMMEMWTALLRVLGTLLSLGPCVMEGQLRLGTIPALRFKKKRNVNSVHRQMWSGLRVEEWLLELYGC